MDDTTAATALAALGHEARLKVFRLLVRAGPDGLNIGDIGRLLGIAPSTLTHHLTTLVNSGLVTQERRGREVINRADFVAMETVLTYVNEECCAGVAGSPANVA
jgi:DNA-binding transcriptional ArsR family regulator